MVAVVAMGLNTDVHMRFVLLWILGHAIFSGDYLALRILGYAIFSGDYLAVLILGYAIFSGDYLALLILGCVVFSGWLLISFHTPEFEYVNIHEHVKFCSVDLYSYAIVIIWDVSN